MGDSKCLAEEVARKFHDNYEKLAPSYGYETKEETRKSWNDLPAKNKGLMIATAGEVLDWLGVLGLHVQFKNNVLEVHARSTGAVPAKQAPAPAQRFPQAPVSVPTAVKAIQTAIEQGFTGSACNDCGSMQVKNNGSCELCMSCGSTTGCS